MELHEITRDYTVILEKDYYVILILDFEFGENLLVSQWVLLFTFMKNRKSTWIEMQKKLH